MPSQALRFGGPAASWLDALPVGNGKIAAMLFGGFPRERIQINDGTAWSGSPQSEAAEPQLHGPDAASTIGRVRSALAGRQFGVAESALRRIQHRYSQSFLPFADLVIDIAGGDATAEIRRELDLSTGVHESTVTTSEGRIRRQSFVSRPHGVIVHRISATYAVDVELGLTTLLRHLPSLHGPDELTIRVEMPSDVAPRHDSVDEPVRYRTGPSLHGVASLQVTHDGEWVHGEHDRASILGATSIEVLLATETTFAGLGRMPDGDLDAAEGRARARLRRAGADGYEAVRREHVADHRALFGRSGIDFGVDQGGTTSDRWNAAASSVDAPAHDPGLVALLADYGRYLLIASSRPGGTPANLQGIWNHELQPPWSSNYTTNINLEMNYWLAGPFGLVECEQPLFDLIDALSVTGAETARRLYGAPGWVAHHNTDAWAYSLPVGMGEHDPKWSFWPFGGAWLVRHLWDHVRFTGDLDFARERAWPRIVGAAEFLLAWLVVDEDGLLGTSPSTSPENQFTAPDGSTRSVATSSAFDLELIADVLGFTVELAELIGEGASGIAARARAALRRLRRPRISPAGTIQEWDEWFASPDPQHRHLSPLFLVHPGEQPLDSRWRSAASRTLDERGDEATGWSLAWKMIMRSRLGQPDRVMDLIRLFLRAAPVQAETSYDGGGLYPNLFAAHPPFQIDGNFGFTAAIAECVIQSHRGAIDLLPAVPVQFGPGRAWGLRARPGVEVALRWDVRDGAVVLVDVTVIRVNPVLSTCVLRWGGVEVAVDLTEGARTLSADRFVVARERA